MLQDNLDQVPQSSTSALQGNRVPLPVGASVSGEMQAPTVPVYNPVFARAASRNNLSNLEPPPLGSASDQLNPDPGPSSSRMPGGWMDLDDEPDKEMVDTGVSVMQPDQTNQQTGLGTSIYNYGPFSMNFGQFTAPIDLSNSQPIPPSPLLGFPSSSTISADHLTELVDPLDYTANLGQFANGSSNPWTSMEGSGFTGGLTGSMNSNLDPIYGPVSTGIYNTAGLSPSQPSIVGLNPDVTSGVTDHPRLLGVPSVSLSASLRYPSDSLARSYGPHGFPTASAAAYYDYVANDPTKTREEIKSLLENIRPDIELPPENREGTPEAMKYPLMEHQKLGLTWLKNMEDGSNKGGILADDMGLGKTIQALALLVSRPSKDPRRKTTLIVAPVALLKQWDREIATKIKKTHQLSSFVLHGTGRNAKWSDLREHDVVLTTFGTLASELKKSENWQDKRRSDPDASAPNLPLLGADSKWYR